MSQERQFRRVDLTYAEWHRRNSTRRFVGIEGAQNLAMIDLDCALWVEYDDQEKEPIVLIETAEDRGQDIKPATVTRRLASRCQPLLPAYIVLYKAKDEPNPANPDWPDIESFRICRIHPPPSGTWKRGWRRVTPSEYANWLLRIRKSAATFLDDAPGVEEDGKP